MSRLAWFTPLAPVRSGISAYSAEIVPTLLGAHEIDVFVDRPSEPIPGAALLSAHDFVWKHFRAPYDLIVYQLGNATCHDYMWPYLLRYPGLVVLHDAQLHHSRAASLLSRGRRDDYRAEFAYAHPGVRPGAAELVVAGLSGPFYYFWPWVRPVLETARLVAVHHDRIAEGLRADFDPTAVTAIPMGVPDPLSEIRSPPHVVRARFGVAPTSVLFTALGVVTPEKRIPQVLAALAAVVRRGADAHLLLVGDQVRRFDAPAAAAALAVRDRVTVTGFLPDSEVAECLAASDVCVCLRWPTGGEMSASWLRCVAAGKPTIVTDLAHTADLPALDPRTWQRQGAPQSPIAVSLDILDEDHSLRLAMLRLARDPALRSALGEAARQYWSATGTLAHMTRAYERVLTEALARPGPQPAALPSHMRDDGGRLARRVLTDFGVETDVLDAARL